MTAIDQIVAEAAKTVREGFRIDAVSALHGSLESIIKFAIEKAIAPTEQALVENQVKAAALQRELDGFQQKLDFQIAQRESLERFVSRLKENLMFDMAAREVWKKQLETATELYQQQLAAERQTASHKAAE